MIDKPGVEIEFYPASYLVEHFLAGLILSVVLTLAAIAASFAPESVDLWEQFVFVNYSGCGVAVAAL